MLTVQNVSFSYPSKQVLEDISFQVENHDIFAILGRNAAGKTTLINVIVNLLEKQSGVIQVDETEVTCANSPHMFGIMRNLTDVYLRMTVYEYLSLVGTLFSVSGKELESRIEHFSKRFEFEEHLYKQLKSCSLGTKKKVSFCAAIIHNPKFVILDEPFDSIDPIVCHEMKQYLTEYAKTEGTILITSHALDLIQNFCNKYIIIHNGTVAAQGDIKAYSDRLEKIFVDVVEENEQD